MRSHFQSTDAETFSKRMSRVRPISFAQFKFGSRLDVAWTCGSKHSTTKPSDIICQQTQRRTTACIALWRTTTNWNMNESASDERSQPPSEQAITTIQTHTQNKLSPRLNGMHHGEKFKTRVHAEDPTPPRAWTLDPRPLQRARPHS